MPVLDKKKLRRDVLVMVEERQQLQAEGIAEFVRHPENQAFDFRVLWKKVMAGNVRFFENRDRDEKLDSWLGEAEKRWLARLHRYTADFVCRAMQHKKPLPADLVGHSNGMCGLLEACELIAKLSLIAADSSAVYGHVVQGIEGVSKSAVANTANLEPEVQVGIAIAPQASRSWRYCTQYNQHDTPG